MLIPSSIKRDPSVPLRTRVLDNGTVVVDNAYEGRIALSEKLGISVEIKGIRVDEP